MSALQTRPSMVCREGILYKGTLARNPRYSRHRRFDEADISTPVAIDQRTANCLDEAVRSFIAMRSSVDRLTLTSPSLIYCPFFKPFGARRSTVSKLASLWNFSHELLLRDRKILLFEGR
ncbi:uncharacterized protein TNCV_4756151 [Trichonephila clavipes]|nr:uncharacterized protein TNCV_4756151 [Trichonephila clavipes]